MKTTHRTGRAETAGYAAAALILVVGGALLTTPVLNWLVGPAIPVVCVAAAGRFADRRRAAGDAGDASGGRTR